MSLWWIRKETGQVQKRREAQRETKGVNHQSREQENGVEAEAESSKHTKKRKMKAGGAACLNRGMRMLQTRIHHQGMREPEGTKPLMDDTPKARIPKMGMIYIEGFGWSCR